MTAADPTSWSYKFSVKAGENVIYFRAMDEEDFSDTVEFKVTGYESGVTNGDEKWTGDLTITKVEISGEAKYNESVVIKVTIKNTGDKLEEVVDIQMILTKDGKDTKLTWNLSSIEAGEKMYPYEWKVNVDEGEYDATVKIIPPTTETNKENNEYELDDKIKTVGPDSKNGDNGGGDDGFPAAGVIGILVSIALAVVVISVRMKKREK